MKSKAQSESIGSLLMQICKVRRSKSNELLAKHDIHDGQDILLYHLYIEDGQTISSLVEKMCIQHATISNMIERMVIKGLIKKVKDDNDMRVSRIYFTAKGKESFAYVADIWRSLERQSTGDLSAEEKNILQKLLRNVLQNFD